jgi:hypothetical protein
MTSGAEIAVIGGGWTALVGIAGFGAAIYTTRRTIQAARDDRLHDQRAALYVDVLRAVMYWQLLRTVRTHDVDPATRLPENASSLLEGFEEPDWHALDARQLAFASEPVFSRLQARYWADAAASDLFVMWLRDRTHENRTAAVAARDAADKADHALVELIREELQGKGKPLADFVLPPEPRYLRPDPPGPADV